MHTVETVQTDGGWVNRLAGERELPYRFPTLSEARLSGLQLAERMGYEYRMLDEAPGGR